MERIHFACWTAAILVLGYALGTFALALERTSAPAPILPLLQDVHEGIPVVRVKEINNGEIIGSVAAPARLVIGDRVVIHDADGGFRVPADRFLVNIITVEIPKSASFVASSRGKKYYPVRSSAAEKLVPANRIYFRSAAEAEAMGYQRGK